MNTTKAKVINVTALKMGGFTPSDRFRINQNIPYLADHGVVVNAYAPFVPMNSRLPGTLGKVRERYLLPFAIAKAMLIAAGRLEGTIASYKSDLTWIGRSYVPGLEGLVRLVKGPRVLDVDDAIWMTTPQGRGAAAKFARQMDSVLAGNNFVAGWYSSYCKNVHVVPDGIDTDRFRPFDKRSGSRNEQFVIGWTGTSVNFHELYRIESAIARFLKKHTNARLCIVSNEPPNFSKVPATQLEYICWTEAIEASVLNTFDIGIMPLQESEWTKGKNSNKMLCYMASGLSVVVSPVETNKEILQMGEVGMAADSIDDWYDCFEYQYNDESTRVRMGVRGRQLIEENFSIKVVSAKIAGIFQNIVR